MTAPPDRANLDVHTVSWDDVHRDLETLAKRLPARDPWRGIVAVTRGGLVPAAILARALDIRFIETVCAVGYKDRAPGPVEILKKPERAAADKGKGWLLIDDIVDTGATIEAIRAILPQAFYAVLYAKAGTRHRVDLYLHEAAADCWIDFPWENAA